MRKIIKKFVLSMLKINTLLTNLKEQTYCTDLDDERNQFRTEIAWKVSVYISKRPL